VLRVWAHWQRDGDDGARDRRLARAAARLDRGWERAERRTSACTEATAGTADTVGRLGSAVRAFVDAMTGSPVGEFPGRRVRRCRSRLRRIAGVACGAMIRLEETRLRGRRGRAVAAADRARRRLATAWTAANGGACPTGLDPDEAGAAIARLAAAAAGDATTATLRELAEAAGLHIGAAVEPFPIETDPMYGPTLAGEFTSLSAENRMKWEPIHPEHDRWVFGPADDLVDFAEQHGLQVRAHALVWGRLQLPGYVLDAGSEAELRALMTEHIATVAGRYAGRIAQCGQALTQSLQRVQRL
jgi:hypothetical protein